MITISDPYFSPEQICESGQCFRMNRIGEGRYALAACGSYLEIEDRGGEIAFYCTQEEYDRIWRRYFDMESDYGRYHAAVAQEDEYLCRAAAYGKGIRILNQELWEMLISFLISQQNNIKRIRKCIETICERYGKRCVFDGGINGETVYYAFPDIQALSQVSEADLRGCGLGYRSRYIAGTVRSVLTKEVNFDAIPGMPYGQAKQELLKCSGVGEKVADCICLFGLHHLDAFPVDTHIRRAVEEHYPHGFPFEKYGGFAGVMQQYIFYYDLKKGK